MSPEHQHPDGEEWEGGYDPLADPEERRVLYATVDSFRQYRRNAHMNTTHRRRQLFYALPSAHWQMLSEPPFSLLDNFNKVDDAIDTNAEIADAILQVGLQSFNLSPTPEKGDPIGNWQDVATTEDVNKAHSTIRQFYRDWSLEGQAEREVCYEPVLQDLHHEFKTRSDNGEQIRVLVPGSGLGRLVFEVCMAGYDAEGNEISYHQLLASNWILNHTAGPLEHALHPFALHFSNLQSRTQQLQQVQIPDVHPGQAMQAAGSAGQRIGTMSMTAADFIVHYTEPSNQETFDAVTTVFFIDTAPNLIRYIEAIRHCLKPNGLWINVGPLLWHFDGGKNNKTGDAGPEPGIGEPGNVELTEEEVLSLVERMGFRLEKRGDRRPCGYIQDPNSMLQNTYQPSHWVARKVTGA
ncbi:unnamed protein product [Penicillium salamii]|uniref:carnosine N-methyltransferase n=1 Tax=Penicillium salamii TaxID=1612424 RepID=A0A9W4NP19_9EURO|nr:unnamed protein product [Penicillium salamii]CAG8176597.1 unnamed protein product [Penicillium salamii]CAG8206475.1 unnamed protein product [Penicillium salamii]CAG8233341.1 unnamed protein product [Penicillium salamii]CAG8394184.1 unnamed protein product [Penicillium salamii]